MHVVAINTQNLTFSLSILCCSFNFSLSVTSSGREDGEVEGGVSDGDWVCSTGAGDFLEEKVFLKDLDISSTS